MNDFERTLMATEKEAQQALKDVNIKEAKYRIYDSTTRLETQIDVIAKHMENEFLAERFKGIKPTIDSIYYNIGKIRGASNAL